VIQSAADFQELENDVGDDGLVVIRTARFDDHGAVLTIEGELDLATDDELRAALAAELAAASNRLVLDVRRTAFIGSTALGVLLQGVASLRDDRTAAVVLVTSPGITRRALEVSGILALFSAYDTLEEALAAVRGPQPLSDAWRHLRPASRYDRPGDQPWPTNGRRHAPARPSGSAPVARERAPEA
jgi:anti-sigma B factor antagonist